MIIGREEELRVLREALDSEYSSFLAVYGRRRIGKTFLIREAYGYRFTFQHAGRSEGTRETQLMAFEASLKEAGYPVISCDTVNAELWQNTDVLNEIERITGKKTKKEVSSVIYNDPIIKRNLEEYLHKLIWEEVESYYKVNKNAKIVVVEVPLLFETDWYRRFDCNILVTSNDSTVIKRLQETRNMTLEEAKTVLDNQMSDEEKKKHADIIIDNNSTVEKLRENVNRKLKDIINSLPEDR